MNTIFRSALYCPALKQPLAGFLTALLIAATAPVQAGTYYWDTDTSTSGNNVDGTGLGGSGNWDLLTSNWWDLTNLVVWPNASGDTAVFTYAYSPGVPTSNTVTLNSGISANQLHFLRSGYTLTGGDLTLAGATPGFYASLGTFTTIDSLISGTAGLTMTGGGSIRLGNTGNDYTGTTTISNGTLIITDQAALGADTSAIVVTGFNPVIGSTNLRGFGGGSLALDGSGGNITISRDLSLQGQGPIADRGAALLSWGTNTLSGTVDMGVPAVATNLNTRMTSADGTLNLTGTLNVQGTAGTTISSLGGTNQAGASFYNVTGILTGSGTLETSGGGTMFLNPSDSSGFSGVVRVTGSAASGQSVLRIDSPNVLGTRTASGTSSVLDLYGGVLAILMDSPSVQSGGVNANVYGRDTSTFFADHTPNSNVKDQTVAFGSFTFEDNETFTFNSRNGYGMSFTSAAVNGGDNNTTFANNLQGGALLTFTGNFWSNSNNTGNRTMTISGNGNTLISGNILASAAAYDHNLTKTGSGTLTITSTGATLDGTVNVNGGTVAIADWRSITNNTAIVDIGTSSTTGTLSVIGNNRSLAQLTTSKVINLGGTTGGAIILANQTGTSPGLVLNADWTATGGSASQNKTVTLGGTNTAANTINGVIPNNNAGGLVNLTKIDPGTWVLAGSNTYTGTTTISNGTLKLQANAVSSTVLADTSAVVFNATNVYAGGTLEFVGQPFANNVETLSTLTPTNGSGTVKLTPGSGGTASLVFASLGTVGPGGTVNLVAPNASNTFTFSTSPASDNIADAGLYYNGSHFAFTTAGGLVRAPIYGTDTDFSTSASALTAGENNEITGSFSTGGALAIDSLRISGSRTLTLGGDLTIRTAAGATASGGILQTGGSGIITGTFNIGTSNTAPLVVNVNGGGNSLTIESALLGTGGFTKAGTGTLRLAGANTQTGTISINQGSVRLIGSGQLGGASNLTIRQGAVLELNGVTPTGDTRAYNNNGIIRNTSATTDVTFTVGSGNQGGTSYGIIEDGGLAKVNVVKIGTAGQNWYGLSTYTGTTTIGSTGIVSINNLQDGGLPSGIGASSNAAGNLIFNGVSTSQAYGGLAYTGPTNDYTDRLFTFNGGASGGARIQSSGANGATSSWTNTGALAFGPNATGNPQGLVLGGSSTGDNRFFPLITDNGAAATSVYKADSGVWFLEATNTYTGVTELRGGALYVQDGVSLPTASNLVFNSGIVATTGTLSRTLGTGSGQMRFAVPGTNSATFRGGFAAGGSKLTVDWGSTPTWGSTTDFLNARDGLIFGAANGQAAVAKADVELISGFSLGTAANAGKSVTVSTSSGSSTVTVTTGNTTGMVVGQSISGTNIPSGAYIVSINSSTSISISANASASGTGIAATIDANTLRPIRVDDNTSIGADFATLSGVISGNAGTGIRKLGGGILVLSGANTYAGETSVYQGTLVVKSLGNSATPGATSVGDSTFGATDGAAITLGNGGTGGAILEYVGAGETSDRKIRLNSTTGSTQIHADGAGPLILTNVANDMAAGNKLLYLRGVNAGGNMVTSVLEDNGGTLGIVVDGGTSWILTGTNTYTGTTSLNAGALGVGSDSALGTGSISFNSGNLFAFGADRTLTNAIDQDNNTTMAFLGEHSLTFTGSLAYTGTTSSFSINNNIAAGKALTFGGITADSITANRTWTLDGSGTTIVTGDITTGTAFGLNITKTGDGILVLSGNTAPNFNQNNATLSIDRGTLQLGASGVIPDGAGFGNVDIGPDLANGDTATLDLNGQTETINGLTMNTDGTAIIDNTSASPASLLFGANDSTVSIGGGIGTYTITDSGAGALSITKVGATDATIPTGVTLTYQGTTAVSGGSTFTIASPLNGTTALSVTGSGSKLRLTGGITSPSAITSIVVGDGGTLTLLDGAGNKIDSLTTLQLGSSGGSMSSLNLDVGDQSVSGDELNTDLLTLTGAPTLFTGNQVTFNLTDIGLNPSQTYDLLSVPGGGLTSGNLGALDWLLGGTPGGFDSMTLNVSDTLIQLQTGNLVTGTLYWRGLTDSTWNGNVNNWSTDKAGSTPATIIPGQGNDVIFAYDGASGDLVTTLEQNFKVQSLTFESGTTTPTSVTIDPGPTNPDNRLEIAPAASTSGIKILTGGPAAATVSGRVRLGADQTWDVADAGSVLTLGALQGEADVSVSGAGKIVLTSAAASTFNSGVTADFTITGATLEVQDFAALGNTINANLANVSVGSGGVFYLNNATATGTTTGVANPLTLNGGTLSAGGAQHYYTGGLNVSADSFINLRENNGDTSVTTARNVVLSTGSLTGSGDLTLDSVITVTAGNQYTGNLYMGWNGGDNSGWTGDLNVLRGTVYAPQDTALGNPLSGAINFESGRLIWQGAGGATYSLNKPVTVASTSGNALAEWNIDRTSGSGVFTVTNSGALTLGGAGGTGELRIYLADAANSVADFTGPVVLANDAAIHVRDSATAALSTFSGVISESGGARSLMVNGPAGGGTAWGGTAGILRLTGLNTFTGDVTIQAGTLEFDTVTNAGGAASSLGQGNAITMNGGTLRFIGTSSQTTNRPITTNTNAVTLSANGTGGASITYTGAIAIGPNTDGTKFYLTGDPGSVGIITGGITESGDLADAQVTGATWTHQSGTSRVGDDFTVTGASTILNLDSGLWQQRDDFTVTAGANLNLNGTGVLSFSTATLSADASLRATNGGTITLGADDAVVATDFDSLRIGTDAAGLGTLDMGSYNQTVTEFLLGNRPLSYQGLVNGTGTLTVTGNLDLYDGTFHANLASTGSTALEKVGSGTVTLRGNNSGLASTGASIVYGGTLVLDYTASNTDKLRAASALDMRGGTLQVLGNDSAATSQSVGSFTMGSGGSSTIQVTGGAGQDAVLNLGAITRGNNAQDGTIRFILPAGVQSATNGVTTTSPNSAFGMLGTGSSVTSDSAYATVDDGTGVWFATNNGSGNIVALASAAKDDVTTWIANDHITDSSGFTGGSLSCATINSLRFDAAAGSDLVVAAGSVLTIGSGGFLVTSNVGGTPSLMGGTLVSGATELVITQDSSQTFEIGSRILNSTAVTKSGSGTLLLSGTNLYTGETEIQDGTLQVSGGYAIGDTSPVTLAAYRDSTFQLLASETIGRLGGGQRQTDDNHGLVAIGSHTLTINQTANAAYGGYFTGTGNIIKRGTGNLQATNVSDGFTGILTVDSGLFYLSGVGRLDASIIRVNKGGTFMIDNNGTTRSGTRILDTTPITLNSVDGVFSGGNVVYGLAIRSDQDGTLDETVGVVTAASGASYVGMTTSGTNDDTDLIVNDLVRLNNATINIRGTAMGGSSARENEFRIGDADNRDAFILTMVGNGGAAGTTGISIIPWAIGETVSAGLGAANMGNSLLTYDATTGMRALDFATEYDDYTTGAATDNIRESLTADVTGLPGRTLNALVLHNDNTAASTIAITGAGAGQSITNTSGAFLLTLNPAATASSAHQFTVSGFDDGIAVGGSEYTFFVVNPSGATDTATLTLQVDSALTSSADITKSGRGALILTGTNTAGGDSYKTTINEGILEISDLDNIGGASGELVLAGGTLRFGAGLTDDISDRTITFLQGGATIDTNGISLVLASGIGNNGAGGLTKTGTGSLTLGSGAAYAGNTAIANGSLIVNSGATMPATGTLTLGSGTDSGVVQLGDSGIGSAAWTVTELSTSGTGTGNAIVGGGAAGSLLTINQNTVTTYAGSLGGVNPNENNLGITKSGVGTLTLSGDTLSYTGPTAVLGGTLDITGSASTPLATSGVTVAQGATLNLINSAGQTVSVGTLDLGSTGTGVTVLGLELGSTSAYDQIAASGAATTSGSVRLNLTGITGFQAGNYDLLTAASGLSGATYSVGKFSGALAGFTFGLTTSDTLVQLGSTASTGNFYWHGDINNSWLGNCGLDTNFTTDLAGTTNALGTPGAASTVIFSTTANVQGPALSTTLDADFTINDLQFTSNPAGVVSVAIAAGTPSTSSLTIAPSSPADGVVVADNAGAVAISAPLVLGADQTWDVNGSGANGSSLTVNGGISGSAGNDLTIASTGAGGGSGIVTLGGTNTYAGSTTVSTGILQAATSYDFSPNSAHIVTSPGILRLNGASQIIGSLAGDGTVENNGTAGATLTTGGDNSSTTFSGILQNGGAGVLALAKTGTGTMVLSGSSSTMTGTVTVNGGILRNTGTFDNGTGSTTIGSGAGTLGALYVPAGASYSSTTFTLGGNATGAGVLVVDGGSVQSTTTSTSSGIVMGDPGYGGIFLNSGSVSTHRVEMNDANVNSASVVRVNGGTLAADDYLLFRNMHFEFTVTGGLVDHSPAANSISLGYANGGVGTMTVTGGLVDNTGQTIYVRQSAGTPTVSINLNGGQVITDSILRGGAGTAILNFNGGTLTPGATGGTLVQSSLTAAYVNGAFGSFAGGAVIDTNGNDTTIAEPLLAPTGSGVDATSLSFSAGSGYIGAPILEFSGDGSGATGYAVVDLDPASGTYGQITGVVLTNPGIGYTSAPTVTLIGGGGAGGSVTVGGITPNSSGGLTKNGAGILTLTAANTYTGGTTINAGTLALGVTDALADSGSVTIAGGTFDLATFNDTVGTVSLQSGSITGSTGVLTSTATYDLQSGTVSGILAGAVGATKTTAGTVTITSANTFSGAVNVNGGILEFSSSSNLGDASATNTIGIDGGTLSYTSPLTLDLTANRVVTIGSGGATLDTTFAAGVLQLTGGITTSVAGDLTKTGPGTVTVTGTTDLTGGNVTVAGGTLNAGFSASGISGVTVDAGGALNLYDNSTVTAAISALSLANGSALGFDLNAPGTNDVLALTGTPTLAGTIALNFNNLGGLAAGTYDLITASGAGLDGASYVLGTAPSGFNYAFSTESGNTILRLTTSPLNLVYWQGDVDGSWSTLNAGPDTNWATDAAGSVELGALPVSTDTLVFSTTNNTQGPAISTTLDGSFTADSLQFIAAPAGVTSFTIAQGTSGTLTVTPFSSNNGISVADNAGAVTLSAPLATGANQTWEVTGTGANGSSLTISGNVAFNNAVTKTGDGALTLSGANTGAGGLTVNGGTLNIGSATALGTGTLTTGPGITLDNTSGGSLTLTNNNALVVNGSFAFTGSDDLNLGTGPVTLGNNAIAQIVASTLTVGGAIGDGGNTYGLGKAGAGALILNGDNTYDGLTNLLQGSLTLAGDNSAAGGGLTMAAATTLNLGSATALGTGTLTIDGGTIDNVSGSALTLSTNNLQNWNGDFAFTGTDSLDLGTGAVTLGASTTVTTHGGATKTLTVGGAIGDGANSFNLVKDGTGTLVLGGSNTYDGDTVIGAGKLVYTANQSQLSLTNRLILGDTAGDTDAVELDLSAASAHFGGAMTVQTDNTSTADTLITIGSGQTLQVDGVVTIGHNVTVSPAKPTRLDITGDGTFSIGDASTATNANVYIGYGLTAGISNPTTVDMSGLGTFYANLGGGTFRVGDPTNGTGGAGTGGGGSTLILAPDSTILAAAITSDSPTDNVTQAIKLGSGTNLLQSNAITIGISSNRSDGTLDFNSGTGTLMVRALDGTSRAAMNVANGSSGSAASGTGTVDLTGHSADLLLSTLAIGGRSGGTTGSATGTFSFDTGTFDATTVIVGNRTGSTQTTADSIGTLNLMQGGGSGNVTIGTLNMAVNSVSTATTNGQSRATLNIGGSGTVAITTLNMVNNSIGGGATNQTDPPANSTVNISGSTTTVNTLNMNINSSANTGTGNASLSTLNISGGTLNVGTGSGTALNMANASNANATATSTINITGTGTLNMNGNLAYTNGAGTENTTLTLNGGTLDMGGFSIGTFLQPVGSGTGSLNFQSGTLQNVAEINDGGTLDKTTAGTLTIAGTNTYNGPTTVSGGTLLVDGTTGASNFTVGNGAPDSTITLGGSGTIGGSVTADGGRLTAGTASNKDTLAINGNVSAASSSLWLVNLTRAVGGDADNTQGLVDRIALGTGADLLTLNNFTLYIDDTVAGTDNFGDSYRFATFDPGIGAAWDGSLFGGAVGGYFYGAVNGSRFTVDYNETDGAFYLVSAIPEPEAWLPVLLILALGLFLRRRRRQAPA